MKINADFTQRVIVHSESQPWIDSPIAGVTRRPLDRVGGEVARATSIVRYDPGSEFSPHVHTGGEEFIVLDGIFQDEHGDYPVGSYIRNPPESRHKPGSDPGCIIFVKLWQFEPDDRTEVKLQMDAVTTTEIGPGASISPLFQDAFEQVRMIRLDANASCEIPADQGAEVLVLDGSVSESDDELVRGSWLRSPPDTQLQMTAGVAGARIWVKTGQLGRIEQQINRLNKATNGTA